VAIAIVVVSGLGWLATAGTHLLPPLIVAQTQIGPWAHYFVGFTVVVSAVTLIALWFRARSLLDRWLMVVVWASILELIFSGLLAHERFSLGFYAGRIFSLVTASVLLIVYLSETTRLYVQLARANALLQHERDNKLMNLDAVTAFVSHEMRQPLSAISANSAAAIKMLNHAEPDIEEARSAIGDVFNDAMRAGEVLEGTRALFGKIVAKQEPVDVNDMVLRTLRLLRQTFVDHGVRTNAELASEIRPLRGARGQLQEVLINLFQNAIEAMDTVIEDHRILTVRTAQGRGNAILIEVEDTGPGIAPENANRLFGAFVTTKPTGMGLGLAICRTIVERHGGRLSTVPAHPRGTIFRIALPQENILR
jgi:signal transduction histidine kinase